MRLLVKGGPIAASMASMLHGIPTRSLLQIEYDAKHHTTLLEAPPTYLTQAVDWFIDPDFSAEPYPVGTLLWYNVNESEKEQTDEH